MAQFRLLSGFHHQDGRTFRPGDIIDTDLDLVAKFNTGGSMKFERMEDTTSLRQKQLDLLQQQQDLEAQLAQRMAAQQPVPATPSEFPGGQTSTGFHGSVGTPHGTFSGAVQTPEPPYETRPAAEGPEPPRNVLGPPPRQKDEPQRGRVGPRPPAANIGELMEARGAGARASRDLRERGTLTGAPSGSQAQAVQGGPPPRTTEEPVQPGRFHEQGNPPQSPEVGKMQPGTGKDQPQGQPGRGQGLPQGQQGQQQPGQQGQQGQPGQQSGQRSQGQPPQGQPGAEAKPQQTQQAKAPEEQASEEERPLEEMTVQELKDLAQREEINLRGAQRKDDIIRELRAQLED